MSEVWYRFDGEQFSSEPCPVADCEDWVESLQGAGYSKLGHAGSEFEFAEVSFYATPGGAEPLLIDVWLADFGLVTVLCTDRLASLKFITEYVAPLLRVTHAETAGQFFEAATRNLFDSRDGLQCAQRVFRRDREEAEFYRAERERRERAKKEAR